MSDDKKSARYLIMQNIGEARYREICQRFELDTADETLLSQMMDRLKPDYSFNDVLSFAQDFEGAGNIAKVTQALSAMARESGINSKFRSRGENN